MYIVMAQAGIRPFAGVQVQVSVHRLVHTCTMYIEHMISICIIKIG